MKAKTFLCNLGIICIATSISFTKICSQKQTWQKQENTKLLSQKKPIEVLLTLALPASGKSETRKYLAALNPKERLEKFGIAQTVELDDFPYVHIMRRVSDELTKRGEEGMFFLSPVLPFKNAKDWGTLIQLLNEDYEDLIKQRQPNPKSAANWLFERIDTARVRVGAKPELKNLSSKLRAEIATALEPDAKKLLDNKNAEIVKGYKNKTIVLEFSRGGADGSTFPLPAPCGYQYSLSQLSPDILQKASVLYIDVSAPESRRKNVNRADPNDPGSTLHHGVPLAVMYADYGCDDVEWLMKQSDKPNTICINAHKEKYYLPVGKFDNKVDKTTFVHKDQSLWEKKEIANLHQDLQTAFAPLINKRINLRHPAVATKVALNA